MKCFVPLPVLSVLTAALSLTPLASRAEVSVPNIFSDHMVLQQQQRNKVLGKAEPGEDRNPTIKNRLSVAVTGTQNSTYGPTPLLRRSLEIAQTEFAGLKARFEDIVNRQIPSFEKVLIEAGAPWLDGQPIPEN